MQQSLYEILQVSTNADLDIIQVAFDKRKATLESRADADAQNELKVVQWAYETLADPMKRAAYDATLSASAMTAKIAYSKDSQEFSATPYAKHKVGNWLLVTIALISVLVGMKVYLDYRSEAIKSDVAREVVGVVGTNEARRIDNEEMAIGMKYDSARQEEERRQKELEYKAIERERMLDLQRQQQEARLDMQRQQMELQRQREESMMKRQKEQENQRRIEREQRYYSCYNSAWSRFGGDGARADAHCAMYK